MIRAARRGTATLLLCLACSLAVACGESSAHTDSASPTTAPATPSPDVPGATGRAAADSTGGPTFHATAPATSGHSGGTAPGGGATASATPAPTPIQYAAGTTPAPATVAVASACVTPGGKQTLTVQSTPGFQYQFDTQYSDGKDGAVYGGVGKGNVPPNGTVSATWTVAVNAPPGQAVVYVAVAGGHSSAFRQATFTVARSC